MIQEINTYQEGVDILQEEHSTCESSSVSFNKEKIKQAVLLPLSSMSIDCSIMFADDTTSSCLPDKRIIKISKFDLKRCMNFEEPLFPMKREREIEVAFGDPRQPVNKIIGLIFHLDAHFIVRVKYGGKIKKIHGKEFFLVLSSLYKKFGVTLKQMFKSEIMLNNNNGNKTFIEKEEVHMNENRNNADINKAGSNDSDEAVINLAGVKEWYSLPKKGWKRVEIVELVKRISKFTSSEYLRPAYEILNDGPDKGKRIYDYWLLTGNGRAKTKHILSILDYPLVEGEVKIDMDKFIGKILTVYLIHKKDKEGRIRSEIIQYEKASHIGEEEIF